jgi:hypothetical protein
MNDIMHNTITNIIKLHLNVVLKNKDTTVVIKYSYRTNEFYTTTFSNINNTPICLDDALKSLKFNDEEIKKIKHFMQYSHTSLDDTKIYKDYILNSECKYENLKFISELLYNHRYDIVKISDITIDISAKDKTNTIIDMSTDYSCTTKDNIAVTVKESVQNQPLNTKYFDDVDLQKMDTEVSGDLFKTIFKDIQSEQLITYISNKTATDYKNSNKVNYMYIGMINDKTLKRLNKIKNKIKNNMLLADDEQKLLRVKGKIHTVNPAKLDTEIYDVIKIYPICDKPPIPKHISVPTAIQIMYKIAQNIVDNKL